MSLDTLHDLMISELKDIYSAETQLVRALPKMAKAAGSESLRTAITEHLEQTKGQVARLDQIFGMLEASPRGKTCKAMQGLVEEGAEMAEEEGEDAVRDAGLIASAQRVEHYEIAAYGSTIAFAEQLGLDDVAALLKETLEEEHAADRLLTGLAESEINPAAYGAGDAMEVESDDDAESEDDATTPTSSAKSATTKKSTAAKQSARKK